MQDGTNRASAQPLLLVNETDQNVVYSIPELASLEGQHLLILQTLATCRSSRSRDQTQASAVTMPRRELQTQQSLTCSYIEATSLF